ncbi:MAG: PAS domain-containing protein [Burkholderiales bacterium]|nr:PAS domain-containing protein [Burkholderiales bacterium]
MNPFARSITTATAGARAVRTRPGRWGRVLAWTALVAGLAATVALWMQNERAARAQVDRVLERRLELVQARLGESFSIYSALLLAARGWLAGPHPVDERSWRAFVETLDPQRRAPGLHHLAFAMRVPTGEMPLTARTDAFDAGGARIGSTRILRAEPPLPPRLSGYDLMTHPVVAELLHTADGGSEPVVSPAVRLHRRDQPRILVVLPVEPHAARPLPGYAIAFVDIAALMQWIAGMALADVVVQVYDGPSVAEGRLLYRSPGEAAVQLTRTSLLHVEDRVWTVTVAPNAQLRRAVADNTSTAILVAGSAVSLLLFLSLLGLASGQARAAMLALRMSDAARARERRFSQLARHAPMGVFIADPGGRYVFVNAHWRRLSGLSDAGASGDAWVDALHPQDRERVLAAWREAVRAGAAFQQDCRLLDRFGTENYVSFSAIPERDEHGDIVAYIGTCMDITARRRAELALTRANEELEQRVQSRTAELEQANAHLSREVEERRRAERERVEILQRQAALLDSIPDMAWLKDSELRFLAVNERVAALFRVSEQDIVGKNDYDFMPAEVARHNREEDLQVLHTGRTLRLDDMDATVRSAGTRW